MTESLGGRSIMNDKDWLLLITLDEERNITKTAKRLFISQPALTYRIQQIEKYFNTDLFIREKTGIRITPQGEEIIAFAKDMQKQISNIKESIQLMDQRVRGTIKIGVASTFGQYIFPDLLQRFLEKYPEVNANIITGLSTDLYNQLEAGEIHIAILRGKQNWEETKIHVTTEKICVVSKNEIKPSELLEQARIEYNFDPYLKGLIDKWWKEQYEKPPYVSMKVDSLETCKELVKTGLGYTILPGVSLINEKELKIYPLKHKNGSYVSRDTWVLCRSEHLRFAAVNAFLDFLEANKKKISNRQYLN